MTNLRKLLCGGAIVCASTYTASCWWERSCATLIDVAISPEACFRVETYKPYWILPYALHTTEDHEGDTHRWWRGLPAFYRVMDQDSGEVLGETPVYDREFMLSGIHWGLSSITINGRSFDVSGHCEALT